MSRSRSFVLTAAALWAAAALLSWLAAPPQALRPPLAGALDVTGPPRNAAPPRLEPQRSQRLDALQRRAPAAAPAARPASLRGTETDGGLGVDETGSLIVGPELRRFFDYFLSATGEETDDQIRTRLEDEITARLAPGPAARARALLDRYLEYRARVRDDLAADGTENEDLGARWEQLHQLRREVFGDADADALFGDEEADAYVAIAQHDTAADPSLGADERQVRIAALEAQLPEPAQAARAAAMVPLRLAEEEAQLRAAGADSAEIRALRERHVGREAADRLEALDRQRATWQARVDAYRQARRAIESNSSLTAAERTNATEHLLAERFTPTEQQRVRALDRIAAGTAR